MAMKKFINRPEDLTKEMLEGLVMAFPDLVEAGGSSGKLIINKKLKEADRVTIVTMGGSGHEPALSGLVGEGMIDVSVPGDVFAAPGPSDVVEAIRLADRGKGVLLVVLNHAGDMLSGGLAMKQAAKEGLNVKRVTTQEDIANAPRSDGENRRGLVGCVLLYHVAAAAAREGRSLDEVQAVAQRFADNMATVAVACKGATHPSTGEEIMSFGDDDMEIGAGQHGEGGGGRMKMKSADDVAEHMLRLLIDDLTIREGEQVLVLVNGSGAATLMEQLIVYRACCRKLNAMGVKVTAGYAGELLTVQEAAGFQLCIVRMDDELARLWNTPCKSPYFSK